MRITAGALSRGFSEARELAGIIGHLNAATFHENPIFIDQTYKDKFGAEFAQAIAGHKNAKISSLYADARGPNGCR